MPAVPIVAAGGRLPISISDVGNGTCEVVIGVV
jgi:hypothetical protein